MNFLYVCLIYHRPLNWILSSKPYSKVLSLTLDLACVSNSKLDLKFFSWPFLKLGVYGRSFSIKGKRDWFRSLNLPFTNEIDHQIDPFLSRLTRVQVVIVVLCNMK